MPNGDAPTRTTSGLASADLDLRAIRERFSALSREVAGSTVVYLDGPGGSQTPDAVAHAVSAYLTASNANTDGPFVTSRSTDRLIGDARAAAADFLGCTADEIVVTELDHDANVSPWLLVARDHELTVRTAPLDPRDGTLDLDALEDLISERTRVLACTLASNALGSVTDIARIGAAARAVGALLWLDGVHLAPHRRLGRAQLKADVLLTSPYKYFGPHLGVAAVRDDLARSLPADRVRPAHEVPPGHRFETGTLSHEALAGFTAAIEYLEWVGGDGDDRRARLDSAYAQIEVHERGLTKLTLERLSEVPGLRLYGIAEPVRAGQRTPTFCFNLDGWEPEALSVELGRRGLFTYHGDYYALGAMAALGLERSGGAVRAGYLHYTTRQEAERLCATVAELAR